MFNFLPCAFAFARAFDSHVLPRAFDLIFQRDGRKEAKGHPPYCLGVSSYWVLIVCALLGAEEVGTRDDEDLSDGEQEREETGGE